MKNVLFLTDFSLNSIHAMRYGLNITNPNKTNYYVFHAFTFSHAGNTFSNDLYEQFKEASQIQLAHLEKSLRENYGHEDLKLKCLSDFGFIPGSIEKLAKDLSIDLVVMGSSGKSFFNMSLFGNKAYETMKTLKIPVLTVPLEISLRTPKTIGIASEKAFDGWEQELDPIYEINDFCKTNIKGLQVEIGKKEMVLEGSSSFDNASKLETIRVSNPDVILGIKTAIGEAGIDFLVLIRKQRSFFEGLFHKSVSKQIASKLDIPILTIPGK